MIDHTQQSRRVSDSREDRPRGMRMLTESLIFLALTVTVFRWCAVEGYMISTGSMATSLFGYHRRVACPACGFEFAVGAPGPPHFVAEPSQGPAVLAQQSASVGDGNPQTARCPNCDLSDIDLSGLPVTEGDQILVHKDAFVWRQLLCGAGPRRWEVAVFRNPEDPMLTYVKRVVGLPGESIELVAGDVYADGRLQRKPFASQLGTRVLVHDNDYEPPGEPGPDWEPRWLFDGLESPWEWNAPAFVMNAASRGETSYRWVRYQHWIRRGGTHTTTVTLGNWPDSVPLPDPFLSAVDYDAAERQLSCFGALPASILNRWLTLADDAGFRRALRTLYHRSHAPPVTDRLCYNVGLSRDAPALITDFMLELTLERVRGDGVFVVELTDGLDVFTAEFDFGSDEVRLWVAGEEQPRATGPLPPIMHAEPVSVQMSTFDRQIVLAVNAQPLLGPIELQPLTSPIEGIRSPARFGARQLDVRVDHIRLYRDVHYSPGGAGDKHSFTLRGDEYFVLGDNSSVSVDSRHWDEPGVARDLLVGKPLLVHLPSRSRRLNWGEGRRYIRVPDLARIRYIR